MLSARPGGPRRTFLAPATLNNNDTSNNENQHVSLNKTPGKTPGSVKRRALGDISNRKETAATGKAFPTTQKRNQFNNTVTFSVSNSKTTTVLPSRSTTIISSNNNQINKTVSVQKPKIDPPPPLKDVIEYRRPFDPFEDDGLNIEDDFLKQLKQQQDVPRENAPGYWRSLFEDDVKQDDESRLAVPNSIAVGIKTTEDASGPPIKNVEFRLSRPFDPFDLDDNDHDEDEFLNQVKEVVPRENTPSYWMSMFAGGVSHEHLHDTVDDYAYSSPSSSVTLDPVDLSLEEEVYALGLSVDQISI